MSNRRTVLRLITTRLSEKERFTSIMSKSSASMHAFKTLFIILIICGCSKNPDAAFLDAVANVKAGRTASIDVRQAPLSSDQLLEKLVGLEPLRSLTLDKSPVTNDGLTKIGRLVDLQELSLSQTRVTDDGLSTIARNFPGLTSLILNRTMITDNGIKELEKLSRLESLSLYQVAITDATCKTLARLPNLQNISLDQTMITDAGLEAIGAAPKLKRVSVWQCQVSDKAAEAFQKRFPDVTLNR